MPVAAPLLAPTTMVEVASKKEVLQTLIIMLKEILQPGVLRNAAYTAAVAMGVEKSFVDAVLATPAATAALAPPAGAAAEPGKPGRKKKDKALKADGSEKIKRAGKINAYTLFVTVFLDYIAHYGRNPKVVELKREHPTHGKVQLAATIYTKMADDKKVRMRVSACTYCVCMHAPILIRKKHGATHTHTHTPTAAIPLLPLWACVHAHGLEPAAHCPTPRPSLWRPQKEMQDIYRDFLEAYNNEHMSHPGGNKGNEGKLLEELAKFEARLPPGSKTLLKLLELKKKSDYATEPAEMKAEGERPVRVVVRGAGGGGAEGLLRPHSMPTLTRLLWQRVCCRAAPLASGPEPLRIQARGSVGFATARRPVGHVGHHSRGGGQAHVLYPPSTASPHPNPAPPSLLACPAPRPPLASCSCCCQGGGKGRSCNRCHTHACAGAGRAYADGGTRGR